MSQFKIQSTTVLKSGFILLIFILIMSFLLIPTVNIKAQSDSGVIYDYVILIDTSGSMNDGTPPLFGQVQKVAQDFINVLQDGSNLTIYSFDTTYREVGTWNNITPSDKSLIVNSIGAMKATGQRTALWDTVCQGLNQIEVMGKTGGQHIQLLISYTDGLDNNSQKTSTSCLAKYQELQKSGFTYWIYNAIGGVAVPQDVTDMKDIIGIVDSTNPMPIRVVHIQPTTLKLGNIFQTGKSDPNTSCLVFWTSDPSVYGRDLSFSQPPSPDRALPGGNAPQVCAEGTDCLRSLKISASKSCLQFDLVNYLPQNITSAETGMYTLNLPLNIPYDKPQDQVFLVPNSLKIVFSLDFPPTATPTSTSTLTPVPTNTVTLTLEPTITPMPVPTLKPIPTPIPPGVILRRQVFTGAGIVLGIFLVALLLINIFKRMQPPGVSGYLNYWNTKTPMDITTEDLTKIGKGKKSITVGSGDNNDIVIKAKGIDLIHFVLTSEKIGDSYKLVLTPKAPIKQGYMDLTNPIEIVMEKEYKIENTIIKFYNDPNL